MKGKDLCLADTTKLMVSASRKSGTNNRPFGNRENRENREKSRNACLPSEVILQYCIHFFHTIRNYTHIKGTIKKTPGIDHM